jgi:hypothetical protein
VKQDPKDTRRKRDSFASRGAAGVVVTYGDEALPLPEAGASPSDSHGVELDLTPDEGNVLDETQINVLYTRGLVDRATWDKALRTFRGDRSSVGQHAIRTCEVAIEALVERAVDAACAVIQGRLGVKTGDLAAAVLSDGTIERELTRYVRAELAAANRSEEAP